MEKLTEIVLYLNLRSYHWSIKGSIVFRSCWVTVTLCFGLHLYSILLLTWLLFHTLNLQPSIPKPSQRYPWRHNFLYFSLELGINKIKQHNTMNYSNTLLSLTVNVMFSKTWSVPSCPLSCIRSLCKVLSGSTLQQEHLTYKMPMKDIQHNQDYGLLIPKLSVILYTVQTPATFNTVSSIIITCL